MLMVVEEMQPLLPMGPTAYPLSAQHCMVIRMTFDHMRLLCLLEKLPPFTWYLERAEGA